MYQLTGKKNVFDVNRFIFNNEKCGKHIQENKLEKYTNYMDLKI